jgi:hypothetical protein
MLVEHGAADGGLDDAAGALVSLVWPLDEFMAKRGLVPAQINDRRRYARMYYRCAAQLLLDGNLPAFPREGHAIKTYSCDISRSGVAFLADRELYPLETVRLQIDPLGEKRLCVVRCRRLGPQCFEVGGRFAK